jgi:hypothetical protein
VSVVEILTILLPVSFTIFIMTLAYDDNPLYEIGSYLLIGSSAGWSAIVIIDFLRKSAWTPSFTGKPLYFLSILLGLALFARYFKNYRWLYRYPMAIVIGTGVGLAINGAIGAQITKQISANFLPLTSGAPMTIFNNLLIIIGSMTSLSYFLFTDRFSNKYTASVSKIGRYFLMATFGAGFGSVMTFRIETIIGRIDFLVLPANLNYSIVVTILVLAYLIGRDYLRRKKQP